MIDLCHLGGKGEKTPLVYSVTFDTRSAKKDENLIIEPNPTLTALIDAREFLSKGKGSLSKMKVPSAQFALNSLLIPIGEKLIRYVGNLKLFGESVTW